MLESLVLEAEDKRVKDNVDKVQGSGDLKEPRLDPLYANKAHDNDEEQNVGSPDAQDKGDEKQSQCTQHVHASLLEHSGCLLQVTVMIILVIMIVTLYIDDMERAKQVFCIATLSAIVELKFYIQLFHLHYCGCVV